MNGSDEVTPKTLAQSLNALCSVVYDLMWDYEDPVPQHQIDNIPHLVYGYAVDLGFLPPPDQPEDLDDPSLVELNAWLVPQKYYDNFLSIISERLDALRWQTHEASKLETVPKGKVIQPNPRQIIDDWRDSMGTTLEKLAHQAKLSLPTLNRIRAGKHGTRPSNLKDLALVIGCDWRQLRWGK